MADIKNTLRKLKAVAEGQGNVHEKQAALKKLAELESKYGLCTQDYIDDTISTHEFRHRNNREKRLLFQVCAKVLDNNELTTSRWRKGSKLVANTIGFDCTLAQKIEIDFLFDFYKRLYKREEEKLFEAFISKHRIWTESVEAIEVDPNDDEYRKMKIMMSGLEDESPHKLIGKAES